MPDDVVNYRELLSQPSESYERPRPLPSGHYFGRILGHQFERSTKKQTAYCQINLSVEGPAEDVTPEMIAGIDLSRRELRAKYYITPKSVYRLADMEDAVLGLQPGRTTDERLPDLTGQRVMFGVVPQLNQDGTDSGYNDVTTIVAAP